MKMRFAKAVLIVLAMLAPVVARANAQGASASQNPQAAIDPEKAQLIRHLLDPMKIPAMMEKMIGPLVTQMTNAFQTDAPSDDRSKKFSELLNQKVTEKMKVLDFAGLYVPLYDKYYTTDEIKSLVAFYESPVGQKSLQVQTPMVLEATGKITPLVQQIMKDAESEIRKEHPELFSDSGFGGIL